MTNQPRSWNNSGEMNDTPLKRKIPVFVTATFIVCGSVIQTPVWTEGSSKVSDGGEDFGVFADAQFTEYEIEGNRVTKFEHDCKESWGYPKNWRQYFCIVHPEKDAASPPLLVSLHSLGGDGQSELPYLIGQAPYLEKSWFQSTTDCYALALNNTVTENKDDDPDHWWGSYAVRRGKDRYAQQLTPVENRLLATIEWVARRYDVDRNRIYLCGVSMGGSGTLGLGMSRGDLFAAIYAEVPAGFDHAYHRMHVPLVPAGVDHVQQPMSFPEFPASDASETARDSYAQAVTGKNLPDPPPLLFFASPKDPWGKGVENFLRVLSDGRLSQTFAWGPWGHVADSWSYPSTHPAASYFPWTSIRKNEAYPVFTNASTDETWPGDLSDDGNQQGQINAFFRWATLVDTPERFAIQLRLAQEGEVGKPATYPKEATADVTLRRLQRFPIAHGNSYAWRLETAGATIDSGTCMPDATGLLTLRQITVTVKPSRLTVTHAEVRGKAK